MTTEELLESYDRFAATCEEAEYTDTGEAWYYLVALADALREVSQRIEKMAQEPGRVRMPSEIRALRGDR